MKKNITMRDATSEDQVVICDLLVVANEEFKQSTPLDIWESWMKDMHVSVRRGAGELIVVELNEKIVGVVQFFPDAASSGLGRWPEGSACLRLMSVLPKYRRNGFGSLLVEECIRRASQLKASALYLLTAKMMVSACALYEKCGFKADPRLAEDPYGRAGDCTMAYRHDLR